MLNKTNIFLVRHGQTTWNAEGRLQGQKNSVLTETGRHQAAQAKMSLEQYEIHKAFVSPLQRAQDTSKIILEDRNVDVVIVESLKEINLGPWEGKTKMETQQSHPEQYQQFWTYPGQFRLPGAESFEQLKSRVVAALDDIFLKEKGKNILVVSHWMVIKTAFAHYTATPLNDLANIPDPKNGAFIVLEKSNGEELSKIRVL
ncbi:histidine phosphatase family protein [Marinomonas sp. TI.3.20]|uniref:histidine phosphatase family protein n=1 Tax=Marinomonas sp. TI.3.20 TaxID=3121296 RepID=UPI00311D93AB